MMGNMKAAVLPEPVWAHAMRSRPAREMGMAWRWTGVGRVYLQRLMLLFTASPRSRSWNELIGSGTFCPDTSTGMSS